MKRALVIALAFGLVAGSLAMPAEAKKKKKKKPPAPAAIATTLYLHGNQPVGEAELPETGLDQIWHVMDATEPTGSSSKSQQVTNYHVGPNARCSGNGLFPTWKGDVVGTIAGDVKVTLNLAGMPGAKLTVDLFADAANTCNADYVEPVGTATIDVPPGTGTNVEVMIKGVNFQAVASVALMLHPPFDVDIPDPGGSLTTSTQSRVFYDATSAPSSIAFSCVPAAGATSCTP